MDFKATVIQSLGVQSGTSKAGKEWKKAEILVENRENAQYPKKIKLSNMKSAEQFVAIPPGSECVFHVEIESREFNGRWYTDVNCYKWEAAQATPPTAQPYYGNPYQAQSVQAQPVQGGYPPQGAGPMYGQPPVPIQGNPATPNLNSLGVTGYQQPQQTPPAQNGDDDLPF